MRKLLVFMAAALLLTAGSAQKTTHRGRLKARAEAPAATTWERDTVAADSGQAVMSGYDKPRRSSHETVFVTNATDRGLDGIVFDIEYRDMHGRQLHKRHLSLPADVPPGETRQLVFRTWDVQNVFYYYKTAAGRGRTSATPYSVKCHVDSLIHIR